MPNPQSYIVHRASICLAAILWFTGGAGEAEPKSALPPGYSQFYELDLSKPWFVALQAWHHAIVARDYDAYSESIPHDTESFASEHGTRDKYETLVVFTPETIKVSPVDILSNGNLEFDVIGCKLGRRFIAKAIAVKEGDSWSILISGWSPPWNSSARVCPI